MIVFLVATGALAVGLAAGWAVRGPARWCPGCGHHLMCRRCQPISWATVNDDRTRR